MELRYAYEVYDDKRGWVEVVQDDVSRRWLEGYAAAMSYQRPRPASRLVDRKGGGLKVLKTWRADDSPSYGMVAGGPTNKQRLRAAQKALSGLSPTTLEVERLLEWVEFELTGGE